MTKPKPIPEGVSTVTPHLFIKDSSRAIDFYKKAFGAEELNRIPAPDGKGVIHAVVRIGNAPVFIADPFGPQPLETKSSLFVFVENVDELFARAVRAGCQVAMPLDNMFWGDRYGIVTDPYGNQWQLATHVEDVSPEEMARRMKNARF